MGSYLDVFTAWIANGPQPAEKQKPGPKPGTLGALTGGQFKAMLTSAIRTAAPGAQAKPPRAAIKARAYMQFKAAGILPAEHAEALQMLLGMSAAERQKVLDQLAAIERAALEWGMTAGDVIDLIK